MKNTIYKARWILPQTSPAIEDGAVLVENNRITAVGRAAEILPLKNSQTRLIDYQEAVIVPSWINAHAHLELSALKGGINDFRNFVEWIEQLIALRDSISSEQIIASAKAGAKDLRASGCALVGDISNGDLLADRMFVPGLQRLVFFELLGFQQKKAEEIFEQAREKGARENPQAMLAAHAPYSSSMALMKKIAGVSKPFTIHLAESPEENVFLCEGSGPIRTFLQKRDVWDKNWKVPGKRPVEYLMKYGLLSVNTLLVHGVQVNDADLNMIKESGATVCICPRSNEKTAVGKAPLEKYLQKGILLTLGTDSLASNVDLDMNNEIYYTVRNYPQVPPQALIKMATMNGARILGREGELGSLQAGKKASFNVFVSKDTINNDPEEFVVTKSWSKIICL